MNELKPCPFCGGQPSFLDDGKWIGCVNGSCHVGPFTDCLDEHHGSELWNLRAAEQQGAHTTSAAPVVRIHVVGDEVVGSELYPPGLPDGAHDLYFLCERHSVVPAAQSPQPNDPRYQWVQVRPGTWILHDLGSELFIAWACNCGHKSRDEHEAAVQKTESHGG